MRWENDLMVLFLKLKSSMTAEVLLGQSSWYLAVHQLIPHMLILNFDSENFIWCMEHYFRVVGINNHEEDWPPEVKARAEVELGFEWTGNASLPRDCYLLNFGCFLIIFMFVLALYLQLTVDN